VSLAADRGTMIAEVGSTVDIRGASATLDVPNAPNVGGTMREVCRECRRIADGEFTRIDFLAW